MISKKFMICGPSNSVTNNPHQDICCTDKVHNNIALR